MPSVDHFLPSYLISSIFFSCGSSELLDTKNQIQKPSTFPICQEQSYLGVPVPSACTEQECPASLVVGDGTQTLKGLTSLMRNSSASLTWLTKPLSPARPSLPGSHGALLPHPSALPSGTPSFLMSSSHVLPLPGTLLPPLADSSLRFHLPCHFPKEVTTISGVLHFPVYFTMTTFSSK